MAAAVKISLFDVGKELVAIHFTLAPPEGRLDKFLQFPNLCKMQVSWALVRETTAD